MLCVFGSIRRQRAGKRICIPFSTDQPSFILADKIRRMITADAKGVYHQRFVNINVFICGGGEEIDGKPGIHQLATVNPDNTVDINKPYSLFLSPTGQVFFFRSEERRVGKECRSRLWTEQ